MPEASLFDNPNPYNNRIRIVICSSRASSNKIAKIELIHKAVIQWKRRLYQGNAVGPMLLAYPYTYKTFYMLSVPHMYGCRK